tara:strand:+ start:2041 stop:2406 length:366 start_codon:yes stop_codon:yes gene_type:complete
MQNNKSKTIFCDLDGTLVEHSDPISIQDPDFKLKVLPGTHEKLKEWDSKGYYIIITTGRKVCAKSATINQLSKAGIIYDDLIMGFGGAARYIINDRKKDSNANTAFAINLERNKGIMNVEL